MVTEMIEVKLQSTLEDLDSVATRLLKEGKGFTTWLLKGDLGSGKTTLVSQILRQLVSVDLATSPTFSLINEYLLENGDMIYHLDLYRLNTLEEALELGITEVLDSGDLCIIEWPEIIDDIIEKPYFEIVIEHLNDDLRSYKCRKHE